MRKVALFITRLATSEPDRSLPLRIVPLIHRVHLDLTVAFDLALLHGHGTA